MTTEKMTRAEALRALADELDARDSDKWAAEFVGAKNFVWGYDWYLEFPDGRKHPGKEWHPSSPDAPLWQLGMVLDKAYETGVMYDIVDQLFDSLQAKPDYNSTLHLIIKNPADVLSAIKLAVGPIREVVENGPNYIPAKLILSA